MTEALPQPEVLRCYFDDRFGPRLPAMCLRWETTAEQPWELPDGVRLLGPAPERFGFQVRRHGPDAYAVRVLWNQTCLSWAALTRAQLLTSSLAPLLAAMGTDLWHLLDQPVQSDDASPRKAA